MDVKRAHLKKKKEDKAQNSVNKCLKQILMTFELVEHRLEKTSDKELNDPLFVRKLKKTFLTFGGVYITKN